MKHLTTYILRSIMLLLSMLLWASCSLIYTDEPECEEQPESDICYITLSINTNMPSMTRASILDGTYDDGTDVDYENYIDIKGGDYRFYIFKADDANPENETLITEIDTKNGIFFTPDAAGNSSQSYRIVGEVKTSLFDGVTAYKAVFVANWGIGNYPTLTRGVSKLSDVQATYSYSSSWTLSASSLIPMFGVTNSLDITNYAIKAGERTDIGTLHLLRAMAKIEVQIRDDETSDIESIELFGFNDTGYCAPMGVNKQSDYFGTDYVYANDYIKTPSLVNCSSNNSGSTSNSRFFSYIEKTETAPRLFTVYVPEYKNEAADKSSADDAAYMKIKFQDGDEIIYQLDFTATENDVPYSGYSKGNAFNLLRNSYYKYTVKRTDNRNLIAEVHPYYTADLKPNFGIETGTIIWEGVWLVDDVPLSMMELKQTLFDWDAVTSGQELTLYMNKRAPVDHPEYFWVSICNFDDGNIVTGTKSQYINPDNGILRITLTEDILKEIKKHGGISILGRYYILYRITLK